MAFQVQEGPATTEEQLICIRGYSIHRYDSGWDLVVETMTDDEILQLIAGTKTRWGAIERITNELKLVWAYRKEVENA